MATLPRPTIELHVSLFWEGPGPKPKDTVPKEQLVLEEAIARTIEKDGNETRVQPASVEDSLHERRAVLEEKVWEFPHPCEHLFESPCDYTHVTAPL